MSVDANHLSEENQNRLAHLSGSVIRKEKLTDTDFNINTAALRLKREVSMYQWVEIKNTKSKENVGESITTTAEDIYEKEKRKTLLSSGKFKVTNYDNPISLPYQQFTQQVSDPRLGMYNVSRSILSQITNFGPLPVTSLDNTVK